MVVCITIHIIFHETLYNVHHNDVEKDEKEEDVDGTTMLVPFAYAISNKDFHQFIIRRK